MLNVDCPSEVGNDRICNSRAAIEITTNNCLVLDFGTATTYDIINDNENGFITNNSEIYANKILSLLKLTCQ